MSEKYNFSIIIISSDFSFFIENILSKYLELNNNFELILVSENNFDIPNKFTMQLNIKKVISDNKLPSFKRNLGVDQCKYNFLIFTDDDAFLDENYLQYAEEYFQKGYLCFGGPQLTPKNETFYGKLSGNFYENLFFNPFYYRYKKSNKNQIRSVPELPTVNFCIKKEIFANTDGFNLKFWPGEDSVICNQIIINGNKIYYFSNLCVYHYRRSTIFKHFKQISRYGYNRGYLIFKLKKSFSYFYILPIIFFFLIFLSFLLGYVKLLFILFLSYFGIASIYNFIITNKLILSIVLFPLSIISILLYCINLLNGLITSNNKKKISMGR